MNKIPRSNGRTVVADRVPVSFVRTWMFHWPLLLAAFSGFVAARTEAAIPAAATQDPLYAKGYLVVTYYSGVSKTGTWPVSTTAGLNQALDDAYANNLIAYFPEGTYLINDTLTAHTQTGWNPEGDNYPDTDFTTPRKHIAMIGSTQGHRPIIKLAPNSEGFNNPDVSKPMVEFKNFDFVNTSTEQADSGFHQMLRGIDLDCNAADDANGNDGAIGLYFNQAQNASIENVKVIATGAFAAFRGVPGAASIIVNIEAVGGRYGIYTSIDKAGGCAIVGAKLKDQTINAVHYDGFVPLVLVGFEITTPANSTQAAVTTVPNSGPPKANTSGIHLIDGIIRLGGNPAAAAINNSIGKNIYVRNVYISGGNPVEDNSTNLVKSNSTVTTGTGLWKRIVEYSYCDQAEADAESKVSYNLVGATEARTPTPVSTIYSTVAAGSVPANLITRHIWSALPSVDDIDAVDAFALGIVPAVNELDPVTVDHSALQAIIDQNRKIFLRKGIYRLTGPITLHPNTILYGADRNLTRIEVAGTFLPTVETALISTDDSPTATTYMGDLSIGVYAGGSAPSGWYNSPHPNDWFNALDWRAGKDSMVHMGLVYLAPANVGGRWYTNKHSLIRIRGSGGGRWYYCGSVKNFTSQHADYRILKVEGTRQPLWIYGLNPEHPKGCDAFVEFNDAQNVRIYSVKSEFNGDWVTLLENSPAAKSVVLKFVGCMNVALFGHGAIRNGVNDRGVVEFWDSDRVLATLITPELLRFDTPNDDTLREIVDNQRTKGVRYPHVVALYKRGSITTADEAAMSHSDTFYGPELGFASIPAEDGWVLEGATPGTGGSLLSNGTGPQALSLGDNAAKKQYRSVLSFNTNTPLISANAIIVGASLELRRGYGSVSGTFGRIMADIKTGTFGSAGLEITDFQAGADASDVVPVFPIPAVNGESIEGVLNANGCGKINRTGQTQIRLRFQYATDNDTSTDVLGFYSGENVSENIPILSVRYGQPSN